MSNLLGRLAWLQDEFDEPTASADDDHDPSCADHPDAGPAAAGPAKLNPARRGALQKAAQKQEYIDAKHDYENHIATLKAMKLKHSASQIQLKIPKTAVTLDELPKAPAKPAK